MNWGHKIILVYAIFVSGIVFMVVKASVQKTDLVTADYYEQELKYQGTIDATENANALTSKLNCEVKGGKLEIRFPEEMKNLAIEANLLLYCVADEKKDIKAAMTTSAGLIEMPLPAENKGRHELKIHWTANGKQYYYEDKIFLQ
jgi:hypothetical protein